ncbi:MAG: hypothetical protein M0006_15040 [Magnetospirillum sp.]|nr:hypothetical protein [Magnetospirillum sp.]MDA8232648.1 hypothetical protein [Magnetospirillum sp.]
MRHTLADTVTSATALAAAWWSQFLSPLLQAAILILTAAFMGLGVLLRWRQWRAPNRSNEEDQV